MNGIESRGLQQYPYLNSDCSGYALEKFILSIGFVKNTVWQLTTSNKDEVNNLRDGRRPALGW